MSENNEQLTHTDADAVTEIVSNVVQYIDEMAQGNLATAIGTADALLRYYVTSAVAQSDANLAEAGRLALGLGEFFDRLGDPAFIKPIRAQLIEHMQQLQAVRQQAQQPEEPQEYRVA